MSRLSLGRGACLALALPLHALLAQAPTPAKSGPLPADRAIGGAEITAERLHGFLGVLASPEFEGRGTGQEGFRKAADFVRSHFERLGLEGGAEDGGYLQAVPWTQTRATPQGLGLVVARGGDVLWSLDVVAGLRGAASVETKVEAPLAIVVSTQTDGSDLDALDLKDLAVIVLLRTSAEDDANPRAARILMRARSRIQTAVQRAGGQLVAVAHDRLWESTSAFEASSRPGRAAAGPAAAARGNAPAYCALRTADVEAILGVIGEPRSAGDITAPAKILIDGVSLRLEIAVETGQAPAWNVLGILRGSDAKLRDEFVGIGCHLDHLGKRGDTIYPGADDDGSGSAGLMGIAQAFAKNPNRPKRSILFMAFCGEEMGLVGSSYFAKNPTIPLEKMVAELQIDMIGRNEEGQRGEERPEDNLDCLHLVGSQKLSNDLHEVCLRLNDERAHFAFEWDEEGVFFRSDHWSFAKEGVPIAFLFTGFHPQYHQPTDTIDRIDFHKLMRVARYVYDLGFELAQADDRPKIENELWAGLRGKGREEPAAPLRK